MAANNSGPICMVLCSSYSLAVDKITTTASFDSRVIEPWTVQKLLERLESVMQQLDSANPEQTLTEIEMVTKQDVEEIWEWNSTVPAPVERCVHEIIEERAQAQPSAPAVCAWDGELTYGELDQLATRLAWPAGRPWCRSGRAGAAVFREVNVDDGCHTWRAQGRRSLCVARPLPSRAATPDHCPTSKSKPAPVFSL